MKLFASEHRLKRSQGPLTEEAIFRACVLAVHELAAPDPDRAAKVRLVWLTPLSFGVAHVHHAWENWHRLGKTGAAARQAILVARMCLYFDFYDEDFSSREVSVFQLGYTTLFGAHCAFVFLRSRSLWPTVTAHMWCNFMGIPQLSEEVVRFPNRKICTFAACLRPFHRLTRGPAIMTMYLLGIMGYVYAMRNWTLADGTVW
jgi:prenyl protein peptidase